MYHNQDQSKFTSCMQKDQFLLQILPLCEKLGPVGEFLFNYVQICFDKYYEIPQEIISLFTLNLVQVDDPLRLVTDEEYSYSIYVNAY